MDPICIALGPKFKINPLITCLCPICKTYGTKCCFYVRNRMLLLIQRLIVLRKNIGICNRTLLKKHSTEHVLLEDINDLFKLFDNKPLYCSVTGLDRIRHSQSCQITEGSLKRNELSSPDLRDSNEENWRRML